MPSIEVKGLCKSFGELNVLKDFSFRVEDGEYVVVLGSSGCGKTTLLRIIAGLLRPNSGQIMIDGVDVTALPPEARGIGFFFQNYALFPHMTVYDNVAYGLRLDGMGEEEIKEKVEEKLRMVGLLDWSQNLPKELSGGMQQRVALARALSVGSKVVLLDEPLNALDAKINAILRSELVRMAREFKLTVIHVTPNQEEAMEIADRVVIMRDGGIAQMGVDFEVYDNPKTPYVAYFLGETNFLKARKVGSNVVQHGKTLFELSADAPYDEVLLAIKSEKVLFERHERNTLEGVIDNINFLGKTMRYEVKIRDGFIYVHTSKHPELKACDKVHVYMQPSALRAFNGGERIDEEIEVIEYAKD
ncbi:MAG: ABC transporter ATP-binding protein [Candidatus Altiarchaeota archaeon]|nr:ABC transporter ATP-binding protein [Candidatus Altiarchaeota archaeon]